MSKLGKVGVSLYHETSLRDYGFGGAFSPGFTRGFDSTTARPGLCGGFALGAYVSRGQQIRVADSNLCQHLRPRFGRHHRFRRI